MKQKSLYLLLVFVIVGNLLFSSSLPAPVNAQSFEPQLDLVYQYSILSSKIPVSTGLATVDALLGTPSKDGMLNSGAWTHEISPVFGDEASEALDEAEAYFSYYLEQECPSLGIETQNQQEEIFLKPGINCLVDAETPLSIITIDNTVQAGPVIVKYSGDLTLSKATSLQLIDPITDMPDIVWLIDGVVTIMDGVTTQGTFISITDIFVHDQATIIGRLISLDGAVILDGGVKILKSLAEPAVNVDSELGIEEITPNFDLIQEEPHDFETPSESEDIEIPVVEDPVTPTDGFLVPAPDDTLNAIPGEYIVIYKSDYDVETEAFVDAALVNGNSINANSVQVLTVYKRALNAFHAILSDEALKAYRSNPKVELIEPNFIVVGSQTELNDEGDYSIQAVQTNPTWGLDRIDQRYYPLDNSYNYDKTASAIHVYVVDSGIRSTHNEFVGRVGNGVDTIKDGYGVTDCHGHGTHVSGTIGGKVYGVAKAVVIHPVRVLGCDGSGFFDQIISGFDWILANKVKPAVVNMSVGIWGGGISLGWEAAMKRVIASGVPVVVAAGNDSMDTCLTTPARVRTAITVGSVGSWDYESSFSNFGECVDIYAPGEQIQSAAHSSNSGTVSMSGTSMAAPHVAGAVAIYLKANPNATPAAVEAFLVANSTKNVIELRDYDSPNRLLYSRLPIPVPLKPNSSISSTKPEYVWKGFAEATQYQLQLASNGTAVYTKTVGTNICDSTYQCRIVFFNVLPYGNYEWRVRALVSGTWMLFSPWTSFTVSRFIPIQINPSGTVYTQQPEFRWTKTPDTTQYSVQLVRNGTAVFTKNVSGSYCGTIQCAISFADKIAYGTYTWRVRAYARGSWQPYSTYLGFTVSQPIVKLIRPIGETEARQPEFAWTPLPGATKYNVQVIHFGKQVYLKEVSSSYCNATVCKIAFYNVLDLGTYEWRVRAYINGAWQIYTPQSTFTNGFSYNWTQNSSTQGWYSVNGDWMWGYGSYQTPGIVSEYASTYYRSNYSNFVYETATYTDCADCTVVLFFRGSPLPTHHGGDWYNSYQIEVVPGTSTFFVGKNVKGTWENLSSGSYTSDYIQPNFNVFKVEAVGNSFYIYANDYLIWSQYDTSFTVGKVGIGFLNHGSFENSNLWIDWATLTTSSLGIKNGVQQNHWDNIKLVEVSTDHLK